MEFPFPGGVAYLRVAEEDAHPVLVLRLPYRAVYGTGERFDALNQKGRRVINKVEEHFCQQGDKTYCPAPFFFTDSGFGLFIDTWRVSAFDFGEEIQEQVEQQLALLIKHDFPASVLVIEA